MGPGPAARAVIGGREVRGVRRPELVVLVAIAVSLPSFLPLLNGALSPTTALLRFAAALALCWGGWAVLEGLSDSYSRQARQRDLEERLHRLRTQDHTAAEHQPPEGGAGR